MSKVKGSCLCGNVTYSSDAEAAAQAVCHCPDCQKQTGTAYSVVIGLAEADLEVTGTSHATYATVGDTGKKVIRHFCNNCGSPIYSQPEAMPGFAFVKAGTLDDTSWLKPTVQIYCETAQPWVTLEPGCAVATVVGSERLAVNSIHHQSVRDVAPGFRVVGTADDGVVEAIEPEDDDWPLLAVQWHPEYLSDAGDAASQALFEALVKTAATGG